MKVFAVGNPYYGDDGVGSVVMRRIGEEDLFPGAELFDAHTDALSLVDRFAPGELNVVIDAADMGLEPGSVAAFRPHEVKLKIRSDHLSLHGFGLAEVFAMAETLGRLPDDVLIIGVQPEHLEFDGGLSDAVARAVPRVISLIQAEVGSDE